MVSRPAPDGSPLVHLDCRLHCDVCVTRCVDHPREPYRFKANVGRSSDCQQDCSTPVEGNFAVGGRLDRETSAIMASPGVATVVQSAKADPPRRKPLSTSRQGPDSLGIPRMRCGGIRMGWLGNRCPKRAVAIPFHGCLLLAVIFGTLLHSHASIARTTKITPHHAAVGNSPTTSHGSVKTARSHHAKPVTKVARRHIRKPHEIDIARAATPTTLADQPLVVIDAGHGGRDPGALGQSGMMEKTITLETAKEVRSTLEKTGRYRVELTRTGDVICPSRNAWRSPGSTTPTS